jgi:rod shape-determining protein MreB
MKDGVIADFETTEMMIRYFIEKAHNRKVFCHPRVVVCVPYDLTRVEKHAVKDAATRAGARYVHLIEEPMAAAMGAGIPVKEPNGNLVVDIGGGTTEIGITSLGGLVSSLSVRVGGDKLDQSIMDYIKKNFNLMIGERAAENLKIEIGTAIKLGKLLKKTVSGRNSIDGSIASVEVTSEDMRTAMKEPIREMAKALKSVLEGTPPDLAGDIVLNGIFLTGGGALIRGLDTYLCDIVKIPVHVAQDPLLAVARGTGKVLEELDLLQKISVED